MAEAIRSGSQQGEVELAAPPGSEWCGDKERSQGGEKGTLSGGDSASRRNYGGGNMSGLPEEPLRKGVMVCPYAPYCAISHEAIRCVRPNTLSKEHRQAIDRSRKVCLQCREDGMEADEICGQCRGDPARASVPNPPAAQWLKPSWITVPEADTDRDFYECMTLSEVARYNPGPREAIYKGINVLFDYDQEHTILYSEWLRDIQVELLPTKPKTIITALGRTTESRQIAILPFKPKKEDEERVMVGAWVVELATWSKGTAPMIKNLRERFAWRPSIPMKRTARQPKAMDLVIGRDNQKVFPEFVQEAKYKKDDLVLCDIPFSPGQVVHGNALKCIDWVKKLENSDDALKPQFKIPIKGKRRTKNVARPVVARLLSRESTGSSACQSPLQNLLDEVSDLGEAEGGSVPRGETPWHHFLEAGFPEGGLQRESSMEGESDFSRGRRMTGEKSEEPAAEVHPGERLDQEQVLMELSVVEMPASGNVGGFLSQVISADGQVVEERMVHYAGETPVPVLEEPSNDWERDSVNGDEAAGEARGQGGPAQTATLEETMEAYLRVASPDIPALFPKTALDFSLKPVSGVHDLIRTMGGYGANCKTAEEAEAEYRARREEAKVWRREREESDRQVQEIRAR